MNDLMVSSGELRTASEVTPAMFADFVAYVDRCPKTTRTYLTDLRQFAAWLYYAQIRQPQRADIIAYREWLGSEHEAISYAPDLPQRWRYRLDSSGNVLRITCRPATVKQYLRVVRAFFEWASSSGLYPNVAANVHTPKVKQGIHRKEALTAEQVLKVEKSIEAGAQLRAQEAAAATKDTAGRMQRADEQGKRLYAMYLLATCCGLRTVELSRANVRDFVTVDGGSWLYIFGKGHTEADTRMTLAPEVAQAITDYLHSRKAKPTAAGPLFVSTGNRSAGQRIAPTTISTMLKGALVSAGYDSDRISPHSLRHSCGTGAMKATGDLYAAQHYLRHASPVTTEIYMHMDEEEEDAQTAALLYGYFHGTSEDAGSLQELQTIAQRLNAEQIRQLVGVARAMAS